MYGSLFLRFELLCVVYANLFLRLEISRCPSFFECICLVMEILVELRYNVGNIMLKTQYFVKTNFKVIIFLINRLSSMSGIM